MNMRQLTNSLVDGSEGCSLVVKQELLFCMKAVIGHNKRVNVEAGDARNGGVFWARESTLNVIVLHAADPLC